MRAVWEKSTGEDRNSGASEGLLETILDYSCALYATITRSLGPGPAILKDFSQHKGMHTAVCSMQYTPSITRPELLAQAYCSLTELPSLAKPTSSSTHVLGGW